MALDVVVRSWHSEHRTHLRRGVVGLLAVLLGAVPALAQSTLGTIRGTVFDPDGRPVTRAALRAVDENTGVLRSVETDQRGNYEVPNLRAGTYRVEDNSPGFVAFRRTGIMLGAGETVRADLRILAAAAPEVEVEATPEPPTSEPAAPPTLPVIKPGAEITVTAEAMTAIQLESPAIQTGLVAQQLNTLPRGSREFGSFLFLDANAVGHFEGIQTLGGRSYGYTYLQDGQPSNGVGFGIPTQASPSLETIDEIKTLSNSYPAEFGGLGAVVVTSKRGTNRFSGSVFYEGNSDELNALTYPQKQAGLERGFPGSNTTDQRFGASLGGPLRKERTFFFLAYEGDLNRQVGAGRIAVVPTERMRAGDFSGASFVIRDPATGKPFPGNVIPANRLSGEAARILDFFYPLPNLPGQANGLGRNQEFVNLESTLHRWDARLDHELSRNDSLFVRFSWQHRDNGTTFEDSRFPLLGVLDRTLDARTAVGSWVRIFSSGALNELRAGYNVERSNRRSQYRVGEVSQALGLVPPVGSADRYGYPSFSFSGSNSISSVTDTGNRADRKIEQSSLSVSDTFTWLTGRHSLKIGGLYSRDAVLDGFANSVPAAAGSFFFNGSRTGNSLADLLLGLPSQARAGQTARGLRPLDAFSQVFAAFAQDDWKVSDRLTLFGGLRYEVTTPFVERDDLLANFDAQSARLVVPSDSVGSTLSQDRELYPVVVASELGLGRSLLRTDYSNVSPRGGFAWRLDDANKTVLRGGFGLFYPTAAAQGIRDLLSRPAFRTTSTHVAPPLTDAFAGTPDGTVVGDPSAVDPDLKNPRIAQYHLTLERVLPGDVGLRVSYLGLWKTDLLVYRYLNSVKASTVPFDPSSPEDAARLPYPALTTDLVGVANGGRGYFNALQVEARRHYRKGLAFDVAYTLADSRSDSPDQGNSTLGTVQYDPYDISTTRGPDPFVPRHRLVMNATWDLPIGRNRPHLQGLPGWANLLIGGWTVSTIVQARSGYHLTPFYTGVDEDGVNPANTGVALIDDSFGEAWRPDLVGDPQGARERDNFFNVAAFTAAAPGTTGNAGQGVVEGPGNWVVNLGVYKDLYRGQRFSIQLRAVLDNAFNHPQFLVEPSSDFLDLTDYVVGGLSPSESNGTTGVLNEVGSLEGFAAGREIRFGVRVQF